MTEKLKKEQIRASFISLSTEREFFQLIKGSLIVPAGEFNSKYNIILHFSFIFCCCHQDLLAFICILMNVFHRINLNIIYAAIYLDTKKLFSLFYLSSSLELTIEEIVPIEKIVFLAKDQETLSSINSIIAEARDNWLVSQIEE